MQRLKSGRLTPSRAGVPSGAARRYCAGHEMGTAVKSASSRAAKTASRTSAAAQDVGNKVSLAYSIEPKPQATVTKNYSAPVTGMVITVSSTVAPNRTMEILWFDSGANFRHDTPLQTGQSRSFGVGPISQGATLQPQVMAVEFEDGTSAGAPQWLSELHGRRKAAYDQIAAVTSLLNQAFAQHEPNEQIISELNGMEGSLKTSFPEGGASGSLLRVLSRSLAHFH